MQRSFRIGSTHLVILGGLAELFAGSISMGLGAYLAAITDIKHYEVEEARERRQVLNSADQEDEEMYRLFAVYGLQKGMVRPLAQHLRTDPDAWIKVRSASVMLLPSSKGINLGKFVQIKHKYEADFYKFMMDFELKLEKPKTSKGWKSALMMGISYFLGTSFGFKVHSSTLIAIFVKFSGSSDIL